MTQEQTAQQQSRVIANRYAVLREIGRGGMGVVWLAEDQMIGRQVAVKELHLPDGVPAEERDIVEQRVLREARTAGRLNDHAIVTVFDVVQEQGGTFIVMELLDAPTLSEVVRNSGALPPEQAVSLAAQLLSALDAAHTAGVVHRDVKPSNIMLLRNGHVKLTDFGIAQSVDDPKLTSTGILIGSPMYMAPERIRGEEATASSDLWALGAVLFFAIEGYSPFERQTTAATMHAVLNEVPYLTKAGGPLASAVMGLMVGSPQGRLTAAQARGLLQQAGRSMSTVDVTTPVHGFAGNGTSLYASPSQTVTAPPPGPARKRWLLPVFVVLALVLGLGGGYFGHKALTATDTPTGPVGLQPAITYGPGGQLTEFDPNMTSGGTCLGGQLAAGRSFTNDNAHVECDQPHDLEVLDQWKVYPRPYDPTSTPDVAYPGTEDLGAATSARCTMYFENWVAKTKRATLHYRAVIPAQQGWVQQQDDSGADKYRQAYCVVFAADGNTQITNSVLGN